MFSGVQTGGGSQTRVSGPRSQSWASHVCSTLPDKQLAWWLRLSRGLGEAADPCTLPGCFLSLPGGTGLCLVRAREWPWGARPGVSQSRSRSSVPGRQPEPRASARAPRPRPGPPLSAAPAGRTDTLAGSEPGRAWHAGPHPGRPKRGRQKHRLGRAGGAAVASGRRKLPLRRLAAGSNESVAESGHGVNAGLVALVLLGGVTQLFISGAYYYDSLPVWSRDPNARRRPFRGGVGGGRCTPGGSLSSLVPCWKGLSHFTPGLQGFGGRYEGDAVAPCGAGRLLTPRPSESVFVLRTQRRGLAP